jgi:hypothetical protein
VDRYWTIFADCRLLADPAQLPILEITFKNVVHTLFQSLRSSRADTTYEVRADRFRMVASYGARHLAKDDASWNSITADKTVGHEMF